MRTPLLTLIAVLAACSAPRQEARTPVPEGINDNFVSPDVDVDSFMARWELESREVYVARRDILAALDLAPGETVADIGAGTGLFASLLSDAVGPEGRVFAVDISPSFVEHIAERARVEGLDNVEAILSNERSAELPAGSVDAALICDVYHHFEYHEDMLRSIRSAIRPGGRLVIVDFERIPGVTREWLLGHVRAGKSVVVEEIVAAGFDRVDEVEIPGFEENYCVRFVRR